MTSRITWLPHTQPWPLIYNQLTALRCLTATGIVFIKAKADGLAAESMELLQLSFTDRRPTDATALQQTRFNAHNCSLCHPTAQ